MYTSKPFKDKIAVPRFRNIPGLGGTYCIRNLPSVNSLADIILAFIGKSKQEQRLIRVHVTGMFANVTKLSVCHTAFDDLKFVIRRYQSKNIN